MLDGYGTSSPESPDSYSALVVTNFAYHHAGPDARTPPGESLVVICKYSKHPLPMELHEELLSVLTAYGRVPLDPDHEAAVGAG